MTTDLTPEDADSAVADLVAGVSDAADLVALGATADAGVLLIDVAVRIHSMSMHALRLALAVAVEHLAAEVTS